MVERRIMNRPTEKPPVAGAENIAVKPKTVEERVSEIEAYAYGIDPIIRKTIEEINGLKNSLALLNEEITKIAGIHARSNTFIEEKFAHIDETFEAIVTIVKKIDDDYQTLFANEEFVEDETVLEDQGEPEPEPEIENEEEFLSTEIPEEYEEPEPEPEPEPVRQTKPAPRPVAKPAARPVPQQYAKPEPKPVQNPAPAPKPAPRPGVKGLMKPQPAAPAPQKAPTQVIYQKKARVPLNPEVEARPTPKEMKSVEENVPEEKEKPKGFFGNIFKKKK